MKRLFTLFNLLFIFSFLNAQETYRFRTDAPQGFSIESSTATGLSLHYSVNEITVSDVVFDETKGQEILLKGSFGSFAEGLPNLPFENRYIAVPRGAMVSVKVKENGRETLNSIELLPVAEVMLNNDDGSLVLRKNMGVFGKDANFPMDNVSVALSTQIRGLDVVMLSVTPFRYNPVRKTLEVVYDMDIEISFEGGDGQFGDTRYRNPAWDHILHNLVINDDMLPEAHYYKWLNEALRNREEGCEYLIITPDDSAFIAWADTLKQFRMRQGILTKVVTTADCGSNEPEDIRNFILNAYENWAIPPAAVLLFGGNHATNSNFGLKPFLYTSPVSWDHTYTYPTDNPFADMNGDSIPDLAISRLTVLNADECRQQVEKLIEYELTPPTEPHYYDHPIINSGYQDTKWFAITAQVTNNFFRDRLGMHPENIYMKYYWEDQDPTPPDSIWSVAPNTNAVLDYFGPNGAQYIPSSIGHLDNWIDMWNKLPFQNAFNEGSFLTFYRDHSNPDWWPCSHIEDIDIPSFHNEQPTFFFSIGCSTNNFWDNWSYGGCIADLCLHAETGTIGSLGANTVTYSQYNDLTTWGMFDYFWPNYMPTLGCQTEPDFSYPSYALVAGKLFLREQTFLPYTTDTVKVEKTLNLFSYLGETYLNLYTDVPQHMDISISPYQIESQREITFVAEENALVCIAQNGEILHVAQGTGQPMTFALPEMQVGQKYQVTVTKQNRFRYQQDVTIIQSEGPFMVMESYCLNDEDGDNLLEYNETASLDLRLYNAGVETAENTEILLQCESPYVEIVQGTAICPSLSPNSQVTLYNALSIKIARDIPDRTPLTFKLNLDNGTLQQEIEFTITVAAPILNITPNIQFFTESDEPSIHILTDTVTYLTMTVYNTGHAKSEPIDVRMNIKAPFVNTESSNTLFDGLESGETRQITIKINAVANEIKEAWLQTHIDLQAGSSLVSLDTLLPYGGLIETFETDTLNPRLTWQNSNSYPWDYHSDDAAEGERCFMSTIPRNKATTLKISMNDHKLTHNATMSLYVKDDGFAQLSVIEKLPSGSSKTQTYSNTAGWTLIEPIFYAGCEMVTIGIHQHSAVSFDYKIDHIVFPPMHNAIAYAGNDLTACREATIELRDAYAYDCDAILWTTEGDGHFNLDTIANPTYFPGNQDLLNGGTTLTLTAFGNDTVVSTTQIHFVDGISMEGIVGDSVVNKHEQPISHYSIENQDGLPLFWRLEPADAGVIYEHGNELDILWDLHEGDMEVTLSVTADNGCEMEPMTKRISLIEYSTPEWQSVNFDLFPNPTDGMVNLVVGETLQSNAVVAVYNLMGECLMVKKVSHLQKGEVLSLDLNHLASGLYIIKLSSENRSCTKKVSIW